MKTIKTILIAAFVFAGLFESVAAGQPRSKEKMIAQRVIRKTGLVIRAAHKKVKENKNFTGDLSKAVRHQRFAKRLYAAGYYGRSIHHSRIARVLAIRAIKANKGDDSADYKFTPEEEDMFKNAPGDDQLEKELLKEMPDKGLKDEDLIKSDSTDE